MYFGRAWPAAAPKHLQKRGLGVATFLRARGMGRFPAGFYFNAVMIYDADSLTHIFDDKTTHSD